MCRSRTDRAARALATAVGFGVLLAGCTDLYFARRDTIALAGGDAVAANALTQTVDPWPPQSGRLASFNGEKMQSAIERYRTGKVTPPVNPTTSDVQNQAQAAAAATTAAAQASAAPAAAPVAGAGGQ